ncbi:MAG: hypothetical protein ACLT1K_11255 [[Clostridium] leptum]
MAKPWVSPTQKPRQNHTSQSVEPKAAQGINAAKLSHDGGVNHSV